MSSIPARTLTLAFSGALLGAALTGACGSSGGGGGVAGAGGGAASSGTGGFGAFSGNGGNGGSGAIAIDASSGDSGPNTDAGCDIQSFEAKLEKKPVDIIFIVDNSCSMSNEMTAVEQNINANFAQIIAASGVDYRVILIGEQGPANPDESICIGPPLGGTNCPVAANQPPVNNPPIFFHYDNNDVESHDSLCKMINWYDKPDRYNLAPQGWRQWLRPEAFKAFVEVTDDGINCSAGSWSYNDSNTVAGGQTAATQFDADLLARDPAQFGTASDRNYVWYSIVGVAPNPNNPTKAYDATEPVTLSECTSAVDPGTGYQWLSNMTNGLKFPVCEGLGFDVVFQEIAKGVIKGATLACEFDVPTPPEGKQIDLNTLVVEFTPDGGTKQQFTQVKGAAECKPGSFYIDTTTNKIQLCTDTCNAVQGADNAKLQVVAFCVTEGPA